MSEWLQTYNDLLGMYHAGIFTTIFGSFAVAFTVLLCWPKLVEDFGAKGGFIAAALIIGTFWVVNHKLPGYGFSTGLHTDTDDLPMQFSLIHQGLRGSAPWVDMGWAIAIAFVVADLIPAGRAQRYLLIKEAFPRWIVIILGGIVGGALVGLTGYTNAVL
ncbi:MAG: Lin0368 family putative glycerol transporter subunit [Bacteroidales bacterium]